MYRVLASKEFNTYLYKEPTRKNKDLEVRYSTLHKLC